VLGCGLPALLYSISELTVNRLTDSSTLDLRKDDHSPHGMKVEAPAHGPVVFDGFNDAWPGYEEPAIMVH
jgi:hypothetical protein